MILEGGRSIFVTLNFKHSNKKNGGKENGGDERWKREWWRRTVEASV